MNLACLIEILQGNRRGAEAAEDAETDMGDTDLANIRLILQKVFPLRSQRPLRIFGCLEKTALA